MVYLVGTVVTVRETGLTVNVSEGGRCNIFVRVDNTTEWLCERVWSGHRVKIAAEAKWKKNDNDSFALTFVARKIEVR